MMIRKALIMTLLLVLAAFGAGAQELRDSVVFRQAAVLDSSLVGKSVFSSMPSSRASGKGGVTIHQSQEIVSAMAAHVANNQKRHLQGYRVRIFFDNRQDSRGASETAENRFRSMYPGMATYRSYQAPFFKVTVGDFRTRSEAMELLQSIRSFFPSAFVVKENINYPVIDKEHSFIVDTMHVAVGQAR